MPKIHEFFQTLLNDRGSDLHLAQGQKPKYRKNSEMIAIPDTSVLTGDFLEEILEEITPPALWEKYQRTGDADFA